MGFEDLPSLATVAGEVAFVAEAAHGHLGDQGRGRVVVGDEDPHDASIGEARPRFERALHPAELGRDGVEEHVGPGQVAGDAMGLHPRAAAGQVRRAEVGARAAQRVRGHRHCGRIVHRECDAQVIEMRLGVDEEERRELSHQALSGRVAQSLEPVDDFRIERRTFGAI